jgi:hypothetical protein
MADSSYPEKVEFTVGECRIGFGRVGSGLIAKGDSLRGFELSALSGIARVRKVA